MSKEELLPKLRFEDFSIVWEKRTLGELGNVAMNKRIFKNQTSEKGDIPFYKIGTFGKEPDAYISRELFDEYKSKYSYPKIGDILISASGSIGRTVEYKGGDEYFQDSNIVWLNHHGKIDNHFLKQFYNIVTWHGLEGSTIKRLYNSNILNTEIILPILEEQNKIGSFFRKIDKMIQLQQSIVNKVKDIKFAYLSEMFPKEGEKYPKKRFEGFTDPWNQYDLGEIAQIKTGNTNVQDAIPDGKYTFFDRSTDIKRIDKFYYDEETIIYPGEGSEFYPRYFSGKYALHQRAYAVTSDIINLEYLANMMMLRNNHFVNNAVGSTVKSLRMENFMKCKVFVPSLEEQEKIAKLFKNINNQITIEEEKLIKLEKLKQAYLNDMFV